MRLKSYFAGTVEAAMALAARELGEDALLVYSRETPPETRYLGRYEVVFSAGEPPAAQSESGKALEAAGNAVAALAPSRPPAPQIVPANRETQGVIAAPAANETVIEQLTQEMAALRRLVETMARGTQTPFGAPPVQAPRIELPPAKNDLEPLTDGGTPQEQTWRDRLVNAGLPYGVADQLLGPVAGVRATGEGAVLRQIRQRIGELTPVNPGFGRRHGEASRVVLVGPPGSGKTTSLVKLAAREARESARMPHLISLDHYRVGSAEQLRTYARILGAGFQAMESVGELLAALDELAGKELVLIDTAGCSGRDEDVLEELHRLRLRALDAEFVIAIPASLNPADIPSVLERFAGLGAKRVIVTRLDETRTIGGLWTEVTRQRLAWSMIANGQRVPEDFQPALAHLIADSLLGVSEGGERGETSALEQTVAAGGSEAAVAEVGGDSGAGWLAGRFGRRNAAGRSAAMA